MKQLIGSQRKFFNTNTTLDINFRIDQLKKIERIFRDNEEELYKAIYSDFKKTSYETYTTELGFFFHEIHTACRKLKQWSKHRKVRTNLVNFPGKSYIVPVPLGVVLVIGAWNYPYMLCLVPLVSAIAAGNTVVLKPSEMAPNSSRILAQLINTNFDPQFCSVVEGGVPETTALLEQKFDKIFFTGSTIVGKLVYQAAAKNLTPVTLELGGKNPVIITEDCNLKISVKRLIWGKFINTGQTCIAPDFVLIPRSIKDSFLKLAVSEIENSHFSADNKNYPQIVNDKHMERLIGLIDKTKIHHGGNYDRENRYIEPTLLTDISFDDAIMQEEIFGPLLPVIEYDNLDAVFDILKSRPKPLTGYIFSDNKRLQKRFIHEIPFGGGAVNEVVMQFVNSNMPFGGIGESGIGSYHGVKGFKTFTHYKSILKKSTWLEPKLKYYPHTRFKLKLAKRLLE